MKLAQLHQELNTARFPALFQKLTLEGVTLDNGLHISIRTASELSGSQKRQAAALINHFFYGDSADENFLQDIYFNKHPSAINILVEDEKGKLHGISQAYLVSNQEGGQALIYPITAFDKSLRGMGIYSFCYTLRPLYAMMQGCELIIFWSPNPLVVQKNQEHEFHPLPGEEVSEKERRKLEDFISRYLDSPVELTQNMLLKASYLPASLQHPPVVPIEDKEFMDYFRKEGIGEGGDRLVLFRRLG